jgi:hypothetical protein
MDMSDWPLSWFEVNCDGSACGSGNVPLHVHPPQRALFLGTAAVARVTVRNGQRTAYSAARGTARLEYLEEAS